MDRDYTYKDCLERIQAVYSIFITNFGEDRVDLQSVVSEANFSVNMSCAAHIIVHWPQVEIRNENDHSHLIRDLYSKVEITPYGHLLDNPRFKRTTFTMIEVERRYMHSHMPSMSASGLSFWCNSCLGTGPIRDTITSLRIDFDESKWLLFCIQLDQYVHIESLTGGPYMRFSRIGPNIKCTKVSMTNWPIISNSFTRYASVELTMLTRKHFVYYLCKNFASLGLKISFNGTSFVWGEDFKETMIHLSNIFINWFNNVTDAIEPDYKGQCYQNLIDSQFLVNGLETDNGIEVYDQRNNTPETNSFISLSSPILTFKGEKKFISIIPFEPLKTVPNMFTFLHPTLVTYITRKICINLDILYGYSPIPNDAHRSIAII